MTILSVLYTLIISPLELFFEVIFTIADRIIGNAGLSIIYRQADQFRCEERTADSYLYAGMESFSA